MEKVYRDDEAMYKFLTCQDRVECAHLKTDECNEYVNYENNKKAYEDDSPLSIVAFSPTKIDKNRKIVGQCD